MRPFKTLANTLRAQLERKAEEIFWRSFLRMANPISRLATVVARAIREALTSGRWSYYRSGNLEGELGLALQMRSDAATIVGAMNVAESARSGVRDVLAASRAILDGIPAVELIDLSLSAEVAQVQRPVRFMEALAAAGVSDPSKRTLPMHELSELSVLYGSYACGDQPRVIALSTEGGTGRLVAVHLRGREWPLWVDIVDRDLALPPGSLVLYAAAA